MCWLFEAFGHHLIGQAEMVAGRLARCGILALAVGRHRLRLTTHKDVSPRRSLSSGMLWQPARDPDHHGSVVRWLDPSRLSARNTASTRIACAATWRDVRGCRISASHRRSHRHDDLPKAVELSGQVRASATSHEQAGRGECEHGRKGQLGDAGNQGYRRAAWTNLDALLMPPQLLWRVVSSRRMWPIGQP